MVRSTPAPLSRPERVEPAKVTVLNGYQTEVREFLSYILQAFELQGIQALAPRRISDFPIQKHLFAYTERAGGDARHSAFLLDFRRHPSIAVPAAATRAACPSVAAHRGSGWWDRQGAGPIKETIHD